MAGLKKKVDLVCGRTFRIGPTQFSGSFSNIILDTEAIRIALNNKATVKEVLKNGKRCPLDFSNYAIKNPMGIDVGDQSVENSGKRDFNVRTIKVGRDQVAANQPTVIIQHGIAPIDTKPTNIKNIKESKPVVDDPNPVINNITIEEDKSISVEEEVKDEEE